MHTASVTRTIDVPLEAVWAALDEFGDVANYNPNVETSRIIEGPDTGTHATRECVFYDGGRIEERIVDYEFESSYTVDFVDLGPFPMQANRVEWSVERIDDSRTSVTVTATYTPKYGPLGWVMAKVMMNAKMKETFEEVLDGLESYVQTGHPVGEDGSVQEATAD